MESLSQVVEQYSIGSEPALAEGPLSAMAGTWITHTTTQLLHSGESHQEQGTSGCRLTLNGYAIEQEIASTVDGFEYQAKGLLAYDGGRGRYVEFWADNMGVTFYLAGNYDQASRTLRLTGDFHDPANAGGQVVSEYRIGTDDTITQRVTLERQGDSAPTVLKEISFTRA